MKIYKKDAASSSLLFLKIKAAGFFFHIGADNNSPWDSEVVYV